VLKVLRSRLTQRLHIAGHHLRSTGSDVLVLFRKWLLGRYISRKMRQQGGEPSDAIARVAPRMRARSDELSQVFGDQNGAIIIYGTPIEPGDMDLLRAAAEEAVRRSADQDEPPGGWPIWSRTEVRPLHEDTWMVDPLPSEDEQLVAEQTADSINLTLARLLVRLGPPPTGINDDVTPVSSGDGGSAQ
jgi:hypothetical protein